MSLGDNTLRLRTQLLRPHIYQLQKQIKDDSVVETQAGWENSEAIQASLGQNQELSQAKGLVRLSNTTP